MPGGRRVTLPQPASSVTLMLRSSAVLLGVVAALCWFAASRSSVQAPLLDGGGPARWWSLSWSLSVAGLGISVALLVWFAGRVGGRAGLLVLAAVLLGTMGAAAVFLRTVVPKPNLIHPIGSATPYAIAGFASAAAACLVAALTVVASGGWSTSTAERPTRRVRLRSAVLAVSMATLLATATGLVIVDRSRDYLLSVNEYRTAGDVDGEPAAAPASLLTGGDRWRIEVPGLTVSRPALTAYGIAVASGESVTMVDRATGAVRWRYARSDVTGVP